MSDRKSLLQTVLGGSGSFLRRFGHLYGLATESDPKPKVAVLLHTKSTVESMVGWTLHFARGVDCELTFLCMTDAAAPEPDQIENEVETLLQAAGVSAEIITIEVADFGRAVEQRLNEIKPRLLISGLSSDQGERGELISAAQQRAPCATFTILKESSTPDVPEHIFVLAHDSADDRALVMVADRLARSCGARLTLGKVEPDYGHGAVDVGELELQELLRDIGLEESSHLNVEVVVERFPSLKVVRTINELQPDLILVGDDDAETARRLASSFNDDVTIAAVRRVPPLRIGYHSDWFPKISNADYADLFRDLRRGSKWGWDFITMLALAAAIASLGLLQNSAAVVIGSMLLAPLMVPMIGFGLALAQANVHLGITCARTIGLGTLLTLGVSFVLGLIMPGESLSPEALARGEPNVLDLLIALFSAIAATYAMARPNLIGAVAGVAIATALVPPLCTTGISIAYGAVLNAFGAFVLFTTNLVAIMLASAQTFSIMGITASRAPRKQQRMARNGIVCLLVVALVLAGPLGYTLNQQIEQGRSQPNVFPVSKVLWNAVKSRLDGEDGVQIMSLARPATDVGFDIELYIASERLLPVTFRDELIVLIRNVMEDDSLRVHIVLVRDAWRHDADHNIWDNIENPAAQNNDI